MTSSSFVQSITIVNNGLSSSSDISDTHPFSPVCGAQIVVVFFFYGNIHFTLVKLFHGPLNTAKELHGMGNHRTFCVMTSLDGVQVLFNRSLETTSLKMKFQILYSISCYVCTFKISPQFDICLLPF